MELMAPVDERTGTSLKSWGGWGVFLSTFWNGPARRPQSFRILLLLLHCGFVLQGPRQVPVGAPLLLSV